MAGITVTIDPDGAPLELMSANGFDITKFEAPVPDDDTLWASSISTEGELPGGSRPTNREITVGLRISGQGRTDEEVLASFARAQRLLDMKLAKLRREGGILRVTWPGWETLDFGILQQQGGSRAFDNRFMHRRRTTEDITFVCGPYGVSPEWDEITVRAAMTTPCWISEPFEVGGDVPALPRIVVRNEGSESITWLRWGIESRHLSDEPTAFLHYDAEDLTPLGGATVTSGVIRQLSLTPDWIAMLSTRIAGVGHMTHVGVFEVRARVTTPSANFGEVSLALEWWTGDGARRQTNSALTFAADHSRSGQQVAVSLGEVRLRELGTGAHSWEGRVVARATIAGDDLEIKDLEFVPLPDGNGSVASSTALGEATSYESRDEFTQTAAVITGATADVGGRWDGAGDADDFRTDGAGALTRSAIGDADVNSGRFVTLGAPLAAQMPRVQAMYIPGLATGNRSMVLARYVDPNNWLMGGWSYNSSRGIIGPSPQVQILKRVAGVVTTVDSVRVFDEAAPTMGYGFTLYVGAGGDWTLTTLLGGFPVPGYTLSGQDPDLATGGPLESGRGGIYDAQTLRAAARTFSSFAVLQPPSPDAVLFPGLTMELRHDGADREALAGATWGPVYASHYPKLAPAGIEGRHNRIIFVPSQFDPETSPDTGGGTLSARVFVTRRYRSVPDAVT